MLRSIGKASGESAVRTSKTTTNPLKLRRVKVSCRSQWSSGYRVRLRFERTPVRISSRLVVFIAMTIVICNLGHGLRLTAVPRSTQPCISSGSLNRVPASVGVRARMSPLPGGR